MSFLGSHDRILRRSFLKSAGLGATGTWLASAASAVAAPRLRAGAAVADMTPQVGVSMQGPIGGNGVVRKIHDPLHARCLVLDDGSSRIALCVCDTTMIWETSLNRAKRLVQERTGLPPEAILISATHSHATPRIVGMADGAVDRQYYDYVERQIAAAIGEAIRRLAPAKVGWGVAEEPEFVARRRFEIEPGSNGPNPFGELTDRAWMNPRSATRIRALGRADPQVSVLSVRHVDDRPLAVLANYSIHYTGGFERNAVSSDYFGCFAEELAELLNTSGPETPFVGIMSNGNSGDIGPARGGYAGMRRVGHALAHRVARVCGTIEYSDRVSLAMEEQPLELGVRRPEAGRIQWARDVLSGAWDRPAHGWRDVYVRNTLQLAEFPPVVSPKFQAIRIGELGIASNPTEMFAETGLEIKQRSPFERTFNIQLANGYHGYLPPPDQHALGGYSTWPAISSYLEIAAADKIRDHVLNLLARVRAS